MAKSIMIQGTASNVGKSLIVAGLGRACLRRGLSVAPFKPQNLSNNAAVTEDGGEIGRAQALQARACGRAPHTDMNPVLLKPQAEGDMQVIVHGQRCTDPRPLLPLVMDSFRRLCGTADLILVEGAGSPAEINLRQSDIANMGVAEAADLPVILVGDIERGGVIAQLVGTQAVLAPSDAARIKAFAINKFHGDPRLFDDGLAQIAARTGWSSLGVIPWFHDAWRLPAEDVIDIAPSAGAGLRVAVPQLDRIANFDDFDPLACEPQVSVEIIAPGRPLPGDADLVLIPGSKSTIADLAAFRANGWDIDLAAHIRRGGHVLGLCGGYQMLGRSVSDPEGIEGTAGTVAGLGHLDCKTVLGPEKHLSQARATYLPTGETLTGYEIHMGRTEGSDCARAWLSIDGRPEGAADPSGRIMGCYMHGIFASDTFRAAFLAGFGQRSEIAFDMSVEAALDALADHLENTLNVDMILDLAETPRG
ncbi:cobyric acid synthase [Roseovarius confluentis]|uniref:cobyric acid synthase n=1 Tax=Roseovarius confluentis TaxID=1852027 RepID=UPI000CDE1E90|nr:cobyric acid synthase [Roseovarius confluentis]